MMMPVSSARRRGSVSTRPVRTRPSATRGSANDRLNARLNAIRMSQGNSSRSVSWWISR